MTTKKKTFLPRAPKCSWITLALVWIVYGFNGGIREMTNKVFPLMEQTLGINSTTTGLLGTAGTVAAGLFVAWLGPWTDRRGLGWHRARTQGILAAVYIVCSLLMGLPAVTSISLLFVLQAVRFGFANGGENADAAACAEWFPEEYQGFILCAHHTGYPWGSALVGLLVAFILAKTGNWKAPFIIIPLCPILIWVIYNLYSTKARYAKNNEAMIRMGLTPHLTVEEIDAHAESMKSKADAGAKVKSEPFYKLYKNKNVLACGLTYALVSGAYFAFNYWMPKYLTTQCSMDVSRAAAFSAVFAITSGIGQLVFGTFSDKIGAKRSLQIITAWLAITFCLLPMMARGLGFVIGVQLILGFCMNAAFPVMFMLAGASVKKEQLATAISCCAFACLFGGLGPFLMGVIIDLCGGNQAALGYNVCLYVMIACLAVSFILITFFCHEVVGPKRGKDFALVSYESCGIEPEKKD